MVVGKTVIEVEGGPEKVIALDLLILHERLSREWLPEYDGPPSTREVYERLILWAMGVMAEE